VHDLESAFWVLVWMAVSFMRGNWSTEEVSSFLKETMSPRVYNLSGGRTKLFFMQIGNPIGYNVLDNRPLTMLLEELRSVLSSRHQLPLDEPTCVNALVVRAEIKNTTTIASAETVRFKNAEREENIDCLTDHCVILGMIKTALNLPDWPSDDAAERQPLLMSDSCWSSARSSSKKALSVARENGVFVPAPPRKRMKSA
jgi:hypothetical protein